MPGWQTLSSEIVYETPWIKVHRDQVINQLDEEITYSYIETQNPAIVVVAINQKNEVLIQEVYRYPVKRRLITMTAGYIDPGEEPLAAAKRELLEEAGMISNDWHHLSKQYEVTGTGHMPFDAFLAKNVKDAGEHTDKEEDITNHRSISQAQFEKMIMEGKIIDTPIVAAYFMAKLYLAKNKE